jgi:hypothetical protein
MHGLYPWQSRGGGGGGRDLQRTAQQIVFDDDGSADWLGELEEALLRVCDAHGLEGEEVEGRMPIRLCLEPGRPSPATARGRCDVHRKAKERERFRVRREEARDRNRIYARMRWKMVCKHKLFLTRFASSSTPAVSASPTRSTANTRWRTVGPGTHREPGQHLQALPQETRREQLDRVGEDSS